MSLTQGKRVLEIEARAIRRLAEQLDGTFEAVVRRLVNTRGRVILTGVGKSGIICRKIAATLASTGTPAFFLHPTEAIHGDLGMVVRGDTVIAVSNSGETRELVRLLEPIKRNGAALVAITGNPQSTMACFADESLHYTLEEEGCPLGLAPMASTTMALALGDAVAAAIMEVKGFTSREFAQYHPGGKLGKRLLTVGEVIKPHQERPLVSFDTKLSRTLIEMSEKRLGMTAVSLEDGTIGIISDGDIRRLLQDHGHQALDLTAGEVCIRKPKVIRADRLAVEALSLLEEHHITSVIVVNDKNDYAGVVHLHDLWQTQMV